MDICFLDQVSHIHGHLFHGGIVEGLDVPECALIIFSHHVDRNTLPSKTATSANPENNLSQNLRNEPEALHLIRQNNLGTMWAL